MKQLALTLFMLAAFSACRERYGLPMEAGITGALVVEGNILIGDTTVVRLSRTSPVGERRLDPESGATVIVEGDDNSNYFLNEFEPGTYKIAPLPLNNSASYRLKIVAGDKQYESEWAEVMETPEIDSVFWERNDGVEIFVQSNGRDDQSKYYKWDYEEVWDFYSKYQSRVYFTYVNDDLGNRVYQCVEKEENGVYYNTCVEPYDPSGVEYNDSIYHCWKYQNSSNINIGSTAALSTNVMRAPVRKIEQDGFELSSLYSILVKQTGISKEAYEFYQILKGNTEGMGSIFDAQPSQLKTNIRCVSKPEEMVVGFVHPTSVKTKRLFISIRELPNWYYDPFTCIDTIFGNSEAAVQAALDISLLPVDILDFERSPPYRVSSYTASSKFCVDCTFRGVHKRPPFWP
jgi:hypothetical protein